MKTKKNYIVCGAIFLIILCMIIFTRLLEKSKDTEDSTNVVEDIQMDINTDDDDEKIDWNNYETISYELTKSLTITKEGVYHLTGTIEDGLLTVSTSGNVKIILDSVSITNSKGPAIYVKKAENVVITTIDGTINSLEDASSYQGYDTDVIGTIFSHDDLIFDGKGTLVVTSNCEDAIVSKDDLKFVDGTYQITAIDDGIRGKDSVYIKNGTFNIKARGDGIKSTNDKDTEKGYILIENGLFEIDSTLDGIQAETKLLIKNGVFNIVTGDGSGITSSHEN